MSDEREFVELRKEVVESRNQAIKTDNQVKNLSLDIKGFEKRFESLERRTKISGLGVHVIIAVTIAAATYMVHSVRVKSLTGELTKKVAETEQAKVVADKTTEETRQRLATIEQEKRRREKSAATAQKLIEHLDAKRDKDAMDLLENLDLTVLTSLEGKLLERRLGDLRTSTAEAAYKTARQAMDQKRSEVAITHFRRNLSLDPDGRLAGQARYYLATQLWSAKRFDEAEPAFREVLKKDSEKAVLDEVRYLLAGTLANLGRRDDAKTLFTEVLQRGGRYASFAKDALKSLDAGVVAESQPATAQAAPAPTAKKVEAPKAAVQPAR